MEKTQILTQIEFSEIDFEVADFIANKLRYKQTAYTSSSAMWGLFCLPENPANESNKNICKGGCIIKTKELGFLFVQCTEDLQISDEIIVKFNQDLYGCEIKKEGKI